MKPKRQSFRIIITISYFVIFVTRKKFQVFVKINRHVKNVNSRNYHLILIIAQNHFVGSSGLGGLLSSLSTWDIFKSPYTLKGSVVIISTWVLSRFIRGNTVVSPFLDDSCMSLYVFVSNQSLVFAILSQGVSTDLVNLIRKSRDEPNGCRHVLHMSQVNNGVPRIKIFI